MGIIEDTKEYAIEIAETALNSFDKQARGNLQAPNGDENVRLFTAKGGSAVTLASGTRSAAVVYDPEASLRNGQMNVVVYERDSTDAVTAVQSVNLGRPTTEFLGVGLLSSGLKVFNSSGVDVIGGTQTAAVLTSVPRDASTLTSTSVANACGNHDRDLASGVISREDATLTMNLNEHFGKKLALVRDNTISNIVRRVWDDGTDARRTTAGSTVGYTVTTTLDATTSAKTGNEVGDTFVFDEDTCLVDTARLDADKNPLTFATFNVEVESYFKFNDPGSSGTPAVDQKYEFVFMGLDAANKVLARQALVDVTSITNAKVHDVTVKATINSPTVPIARAILQLTRTTVNVTDSLEAAETVSKITAFEETSDIPARPVHVCVFEGLNASATLNINSTALLCGVPDSTNVFIASALSRDRVYDYNAVEIFLRSVTRMMPRAFTVSGHGAVSKTVSAFYNDEETTIAFKAMSFDKVSSAIKQAAKLAKVGASDVRRIMDELEPVMRVAGTAASMLPGPVGTAGRMMRGGSDMMRM
jgi:hypothetical protein